MASNLENVIDRILASYSSIGGINHLHGPNLPSMESIIRIIYDFESILFPGFKTEESLDEQNLRCVLGENVYRIMRSLSSEICKSLAFAARSVGSEVDGACREPEDVEGSRRSAEEMTVALLEKIPDIRRRLRMDVEAAFTGDPAAKSREEVILAYPGVEAVLIHRVAHELWQMNVPLIPRMMSEYIHGKTGIDIHPGATIGDYFFIDHATGVVVGETTVIGNRVKVYQGVTIGALSVNKDEANRKRHPTIEDDVTIYAGATILGGNTTIGRGSVIGGNVWITSSVPPGSKIYNKPVNYVRRQSDPELDPQATAD